MQPNTVTLIHARNDPTELGLAIAAKYLKVDVTNEVKDSYDAGPIFKTKDGVESKSLTSFILDTLGPKLSKDIEILPLNDAERSLITSKSKIYSSFLKSLITDTNLLESGKITKLNDTVSDSKMKMGEYASILKTLNNHLENNTYIVGHKISISDIVAFISLYHIYFSVLEHSYATIGYPHLTRWFDLILHQDEVQQVVKNKFKYCDSSSWKELQSYCESKTTEQKTSEQANAVEYKFSLLDWKTLYNTKSAEESIKWFWDNYYPEEFSAYKVQYKYLEDLKTPLSAKNLILGFYQRIEPASKTSFGVLLVLGKPGNVNIRGYMLFRGTGIHPAVIAAPDFDSFTFTPADITKPEIKADYNEYLSWADTVEGLTCCDGKVFQ